MSSCERISRRSFLKKSAQISFGNALASSIACKSFNKKKEKPNVLFFLSDQHRAVSMPGEPYCDVIAPNLQRLAKEGVTFTQCISNYPLCSPFRGMLISGRWPYNTGILDNELELKPSETSIGELFRKGGYYTGYIGKWHLFERRNGIVTRFVPRGAGGRHGFEYWQVWGNTNAHYSGSFTYNPDSGENISPIGYNATLMTDQALSFLDRQVINEKPFFLVISVNPPHSHHNRLPKEIKNLYQPEKLKLRPNCRDEIYSYFKSSDSYGFLHKNLREALSMYYGHITAVDREIGRIIDKLDELGISENTIMVYASDHGNLLGSHGRMGKRWPWEESIRIPFMVRWSKKIKAGTKTDVLCRAIDIHPTLCGLAGLKKPGLLDGMDLSNACFGKTTDDADCAYIMHIAKEHSWLGKKHTANLFRGVRTLQYTYSYEVNKGPWLLYNNLEDPYQIRNLITEKDYKKIAKELHDMTREWMKMTNDPFHLPDSIF